MKDEGRQDAQEEDACFHNGSHLLHLEKQLRCERQNCDMRLVIPGKLAPLFWNHTGIRLLAETLG